MQLDFQQGIITYPSTGANQQFLADSGTGVSLQTANGRVDITFAGGSDRNYLLTEASDTVNAWTGLPATGTPAWLYWDISFQTGVRTFGLTLLQPFVGPVAPVGATVDQHWFDTTTNKMFLFGVGGFRQVLRVFAAKYDGIVFTPLGVGFGGKPFAGTQVGSNIAGSTTGRILVDNLGNPIRTADNALMTTEDEIFVNGSPVNTVRLDATVINATALEPMGRYSVVSLTQFDKINLANYIDTGSTAIGMLMENLITGQTGTLCVQGYVSNPLWNFTTVGAPLWISSAGQLVEVDPHVSDPITNNVGKVPVGRVFSPSSIYFDQGMGGKGDAGSGGTATIDIATPTILGISKLSVVAADVNNPVVVGDNDPRNTNARVPLGHVQASNTIITNSYGTLTGANLNVQLQQIEDGKVKRAGDTMLGSLILAADPVVALEAATKQYVDNVKLVNLADVSAGGIADGQVLTYAAGLWSPQAIGITFPLHAPDGGPQYSFTSNAQAGMMYAAGIGPSSDNRVTVLAPNGTAFGVGAIPGAVEIYGGGMFGTDVTTLTYSMLGGDALAVGGNITGTGASLVASSGYFQNGNGNFTAQASDSSPMTIDSSQARVEPSTYTTATDILHAGGFTFTVAANGAPTRTDGGPTESGGFTFTSAPADTVQSFKIEHGLPTGFPTAQVQEFTAFGELKLNSSSGNAGDVLTSGGANQPAVWAPTAGGGGGSGNATGVYRLFGNSNGNFSGSSYSDWTYSEYQASPDVVVSYGGSGWTFNTQGVYEIIVAMSAAPNSGTWTDNPVVYGTRCSNSAVYHDQSNYSSTGGAGVSSFSLLGSGAVQMRKWTDRFIVDSNITGNNFNVYAYGNSYGGSGISMSFTAEVTIRRIS